MKKLLAILLSVLMLAGVFAVGVTRPLPRQSQRPHLHLHDRDTTHTTLARKPARFPAVDSALVFLRVDLDVT